jgi:hypothetical protein
MWWAVTEACIGVSNPVCGLCGSCQTKFYNKTLYNIKYSTVTKYISRTNYNITHNYTITFFFCLFVCLFAFTLPVLETKLQHTKKFITELM